MGTFVCSNCENLGFRKFGTDITNTAIMGTVAKFILPTILASGFPRKMQGINACSTVTRAMTRFEL